MRVAFFGGTFDPIHRGHLHVAAAAAEAFTLDRVLFAPVGHQPLKAEPALASYTDRLAMVTLALASTDNPQPATSNFLPSTLDAPRPNGAPNYTVDTLTTLGLEYPAAELFVLIGADSFLDLRRWRSPDRLLQLAEWVVVSRPDFPIAEAQLQALAPTPARRQRIHLLTSVHEEVSATELRLRLRTGDSCPGLLPPAVSAYIQSHHLYQSHDLYR
jgi:nicotinate-nucleotide adenylyltransferase